MRLIVLAGVLMLMNLEFLYSQDSNEKTCKILRYVTDVKSVAEDAKELSVNMLFQLNSTHESGSFKFNIPSADKIRVVSYTVRVFDSNGELIYKDKKKRTSVNEFSSFNPRFIASKHLGHTLPLTVEWDFRLIVYKPNGEYRWPSICAGYQQIDEASLRLNFEEVDEFKFTSNIEANQAKDIKTGAMYYLWNIKKLTPDGGEFNNEKVVFPNITINF